MFYSHTILARKSPLGTVWIAAHLERKIKKPQIDGIDIPTYAESIMFPEVPIALRLSGHLLLGLVRIYSWKVEPAAFDSIILPPTLNLDDLNLDDVISQMSTPDNHQKTLDQITLAEEREYVTIDLDEDDRVEPPACGVSPYMGPEPFEAGYMKDQVYGPVGMLLCKRRKVPQTALDMWKFSRSSRKGSTFLLEPLVQGMCTYLHGTYDRNFPRVSDPDAEPTSIEPMADYGGSHGNEDRPPEGDWTPKSPQNTDAQPEPQPTPKSPGGAGAACDEDMLPEFPRFSPVDMPSPIREEDSPFKTVRRTPHSGLGGTGFTEMPQSVRTNSLPGRSTPHSDHIESLFPVNDDFDDQPEIPGLISTPGSISNAGTGTAGLGSMSARTRAVALFFKDPVPSSTSDEQPGKFSLSRILEGKVRKQAARMFFETMVLKSYDYIDVQQEKPYGDIEISVRPSLAEAKL